MADSLSVSPPAHIGLAMIHIITVFLSQGYKLLIELRDGTEAGRLGRNFAKNEEYRDS